MHAETIRWQAATLTIALLVLALIVAFAMARGVHPHMGAMHYERKT